MGLNDRPTTVLLAAGGTGGHVFPALALADELYARNIKVIFATDNRGAKYIKDRPWLAVHIIASGTLRKHPIQFFTDIARMLWGLLQSFDLMRSNAPDVIVGFGGYPCFPPVFSGQILGVPTLLHEQNAVIGKANAGLAKLCTRLALSLPDFTGLNKKTRAKTIVTGNPVRPEIAALSEQPYTPPEPDGRFRILIMGGSQGTTVLGRDLPPLFAHLPEHLRKRLDLVHQIRTPDLAAAQMIYQKAGITARITDFITDVPLALQTCHLFIGRSGASNVAEICVMGRPAIFVPYPHHKDQQQLKNAEIVARAGGAIILPEHNISPQTLLAHLTRFMQTPAELGQMAAGSKSCGQPHAAANLADAVIGLVK